MANSNNVVTRIREMLREAATQMVEVQSEQAALIEKRDGAYAGTIKAAVAAGDGDTFEKACNAFFDDIRNNRRGLAEKIGAEKAAKLKKGKPQWKVPGSLSTAKSVLVLAYKHKIPMMDGSTPRTFGAIRTDAYKAREAEQVENLSDRDRAVAEIRKALDTASEQLDGTTTAGLEKAAEMVGALIQYLATEGGEKAATDGAKLADAAPKKAAKKKAA